MGLNVTTRKQYQVYPHPIGIKKTYSGGVLIDTAYFTGYNSFRQVTSSHGNRYSLLGKGGDIGGAFGTQLVRAVSDTAFVHATSGPFTGGASYTYDGPISAWSTEANASQALMIQPSSTNQLNAYGTTAIARSLPTNPLSGMGQFLGELRDLPKPADLANWKAIIQNFRQETKSFNFDKVSRKAAGEYLNHVFGWVPFLNDLYDFADTVKHASARMQAYAKGSNHPIRRRYSFPIQSSTEVSTISSSWSGFPALPSPMYSSYGVLTRTITTSAERWFSGTYTYYLPPVIPEDNEFVQAINKWKIAEAYANRLFGLRLTPDLLYKIAPWSWALDWVTNTGDVIHNWSSFANDGLVLKHGYLMEKLSSVTEYSCSEVRFKNGAVAAPYDRFESVTKSRHRATPYGFGVNPASFNAKQWSVIAALGISKYPRSLNF